MTTDNPRTGKIRTMAQACAKFLAEAFPNVEAGDPLLTIAELSFWSGAHSLDALISDIYDGDRPEAERDALADALLDELTNKMAEFAEYVPNAPTTTKH